MNHNDANILNSAEIVAQLTADQGKKQLEFPIDAFPPELGEIARHFAEAYRYPPDYGAAAMLGALSTAIGRTHILQAGSYIALANVWLMIVGAPGLNKSQSLTPAFAPIRAHMAQKHEAWKTAIRDWKSLAKEERDSTPQPVFTKTVLSDTTIEALLRAFVDNPRGLAMVVDELAGWLKSMNQYRPGGDLETYLSTWMGLPILKSRVTSGDTYVESTWLSIIGTIQPSVLTGQTGGNEENGFLDRFLFVSLDNVRKPYPSLVYIDPHVEAKYAIYIQRLLEKPMPEQAGDNTLWYPPDSWQLVDAWVRKNIDAQNDTEDDTERAIRAKMDVYVHRFALILQMAQYAVTGNHHDKKHIAMPAAVGATKLADYFLDMAFAVRISPPSERLSGKWREVYDFLPDGVEFTREAFMSLCVETFDIKEPTAKVWLEKQAKAEKLIRRVKHGVYVKV